MDIKKLSDKLSVSPQISTDEMAEIAQLGFKALICNRPDGEAPDQPTFATIEASAKAAGLEIRYIPVVGGNIGAPEVQAFANAMVQMQGPILAYCRSGARSTMLWTASGSK